jgi:hypothetical protein
LGNISYKLWEAKMSRADRKTIVGEVASVLHILHNFVKKHLSDENFDRLKWRIDWTLTELLWISKKVSVWVGGCGLVYL